MTNSRRKLFTSIVSFALVAVIGVGAIVAVFAALIAQVDSGFKISYTASNVQCIVTGSYTQRYGVQNQTLGAPIVFDSTTTADNATKRFDTAPDVNFKNADDYLEFHFSIQNTGENGFSVSVALEKFENPDFKVEYTKNVRATGDTTAKFDFDNSKTMLAESYVTANGSLKEYLDIGVRISLIGIPTKDATADGNFNFTLNGLAEKPADIWDADLKQLDKENVDKLLKMISADPHASTENMTEVDNLATAKTASDFFRNSMVAGKEAGDLIVTLGGLTWHACYLSKDKQSNDILTLWLTSSQQKAFEGMPAAAGDYFGFIEGSLYSDWSANWGSSGTSSSYPSNMYGTSYIRAVTLNNGGNYATSGTTYSSYTKNNGSVFALFTMEAQGLTQYLVTPRNVEWQEYGQSAKNILGENYNLPNENWSSDTEKVPNTGFYKDGAEYNYANKGEYNSAWANDYLWLPSMSETGYNSGTHGLWQLNVAQRKNGTLSSTTSVGNVGQISGFAYNYSWLRSGNYNNALNSFYLYPSGSDDNNSRYVSDSYAVRPALHLNLTAAAQALNG